MNNPICNMHIIGPKCRERFLPFLESGPLAGRGVTMAGLSDLREQYCMSRANPTFCLLLGTLAGEARFLTEKSDHRLQPGELLIAPAHSRYRYELIRGRRWEIVWFHFSASEQNRPGSPTIVAVESLPKLAEEMDDIIREASVRSRLNIEARHAKESYVAVLLQRLMRTEEAARQSRYEKSLAELWRAVMDELSRQWTLQELAELAGYSAGHLNRVCRQYYGRPAMKQLTCLRMEYAARLLSQGSLKIVTVAAMVGYENQFAFSVAFKRHFGISPSGVRERS